MSARRRLPNRGASPACAPSALEVFRARCAARSYLVAAGEIDLHDAVDRLQHDAISTGLVAAVGQDEVQGIMAAAFRGRT
jgi:hypothetical protein